jgi:hypothetical protein
MGSRGSSSGISDSGKPYGSEYETLLRVDNIKFVRHLTGSSTPPLETMSADRGRIYVTINNRNQMKNITFYDENGHKNRQIDLNHVHKGLQPHVHLGYDTHSGDRIALTKREQRLERKVKKAWQSYMEKS